MLAAMAWLELSYCAASLKLGRNEVKTKNQTLELSPNPNSKP